MPVSIEYDWQQTDETVVVTARIPGVSAAKLDVTSSDLFLKVNATPMLLELDLFDRVDDARSSATVSKGTVRFTLAKQEAGVAWPALTVQADMPRDERLDRRAASLQRAEQAEKEEREKKRQEQVRLEREAQRKQTEAERAERQVIKQRQQAEMDAAVAEVEAWADTTTDRAAGKVDAADEGDENRDNDENSNDGEDPDDGAIFVDASKKNAGKHDLPGIRRSAGVITCSFTPRRTAAPTRASVPESVEPPRQPAVDESALSGDRDPVREGSSVLLKAKGDKFFQAKDYHGAANAYTEAIKTDGANPALFSNLAACMLATQQWEPCLLESTKALILMNDQPEHMSDKEKASRVRALCRRAAAYGQLGLPVESRRDLEEASKLNPSNESIRADLAKMPSLSQQGS